MYAIEKIRPNPNQPRRTFDEAALATLADSIRQKGVIQPLILRPTADGTYEIVAGERRWRAAQIAQLHEIPAIVRDFDDTEVLEVAIIENIQRADLNAVEEALGYRQLMDRFGHTQEKIAEALSRSRSHIANLLRLLNLPEDVLDLVRTSQLSAGHARALITTRDPSGLAKQVVAKGLSVRQTEDLVRKLDAPQSGGSKPKRAGSEKDADTKALENDLSAGLGMKVVISHNAVSGGGALTIDYANLDDLDWLCGALSARQRPIH
jgi:ParB family chromosome partitioning protein